MTTVYCVYIKKIASYNVNSPFSSRTMSDFKRGLVSTVCRCLQNAYFRVQILQEACTIIAPQIPLQHASAPIIALCFLL